MALVLLVATSQRDWLKKKSGYSCRSVESDEIINLKKTNNNTKFIKLDVTDTKKFEKILSENDHIIHLAAILGTSETITTYDVEDVGW